MTLVHINGHRLKNRNGLPGELSFNPKKGNPIICDTAIFKQEIYLVSSKKSWFDDMDTKLWTT